jgi:4'-phosphopantetheinyl transferase
MTLSTQAAIPTAVPLGGGAAVVWLLGAATLDALAFIGFSWIDADERSRAQRFRNSADAQRFIGRRAAVRSLAAQYLGLQPNDITFDRTCQICGDHTHGRPRVSNLSDERTLHFGVSAARYSAAVIMSTDFELAVDIEPIDLVLPSGFIRDGQVFARGEQARLAALDARHGGEVALQWWTAKEAVLKLTGYGLSRAPSTIDVSALDQAGGQVSLGNRDVVLRTAPLTATGYVGSLALWGEPSRIDLIVQS